MRDPFAFDEESTPQFTLNNYRSILQNPGDGRPAPPSRPSYAERRQAWENADADSGGKHTEYFNLISRRYPKLSPMEVKVAVLRKAGLECGDMSKLLGIEEKTVNRHCANMRRKLGFTKEELARQLGSL